MLEKSVIEHCSPTLASIKTGNLFTYKYESEEELWKSVDDFNECVKEKGVSITVLRKSLPFFQPGKRSEETRCSKIYEEIRL